jgi:cytochrome c biogenesis DsbD-like protein
VVSGRVGKSFAAALFAAAVLPGTALAQDVPAATVSWTIAPQDVARPGRAALTLRGSVVPGWHVYALKQAPEGPTPLLISVAANDVAKPDGAPAGSTPTKIHDPAFNLETQFYSGAFTVTVPVRFKPHAGGQQVIPVDVRFQTCNGKVCEPPKTVRLTAPVTLAWK